MKLISIVTVLGMILLYFVDMALKIQLFNLEMLAHSGIRFLTGFVILGISVFYAHAIKFKSAVYIVLALILADDVWDYLRHVDSFNPEVILHGIYMLLWGALMGYVVVKAVKVE